MRILALIFFSVAFLFSQGNLFSQSPIGVWKTINEESGEAESHIKIYEKEGKLYGKIVKLLKDGQTHCEKCPEPQKDQPLQGLKLMWDLEKEGDEWDNGEILDPVKGKVYSCKIYLEEPDRLKVRGYLGFSAFGRSQEWIRVK
ncbi:MAG: DUF2147 domain-containing protein [Bacteroidetes bacterium]|jgi:uncharacterized protein (DUF2147 family)|nr:DUF2147 domain-containing protein [Bacteroidota bacterium]